MNQYPAPNPYAPPQAPHGYAPAQAQWGAAPSARVEGKLLVAENGSPLPAVCLKCGGAPTAWPTKKFQYTPPWAFMFGWLGVLIFSRRSTFQVPLCEEHRGVWSKWNVIAWLSWLPGVVLLAIGGLVADVAEDAGAALMLLGSAVMLVGFFVALIVRSRKIVMPSRIDRTHSWLRGVHPAVLQSVAAPPQAYGYPQAQAPQGYPMPQAQYAPYPGFPG